MKIRTLMLAAIITALIFAVLLIIFPLGGPEHPELPVTNNLRQGGDVQR